MGFGPPTYDMPDDDKLNPDGSYNGARPVPAAPTGVYGTQVTGPVGDVESYRGVVNPNASYLGGEAGFSADEYYRLQEMGAQAGAGLGRYAGSQASVGRTAATGVGQAAQNAADTGASVGSGVSTEAANRAAALTAAGRGLGQGVTQYSQAQGQGLAATGDTLNQSVTQMGQRVGGDLANTGAGIQQGLGRTGQQLQAGVQDTAAQQAAMLRASGQQAGANIAGTSGAGADRLSAIGARGGSAITGYGQNAAAGLNATGAGAAGNIMGAANRGQTALGAIGGGAARQGGATEGMALGTSRQLAGLEAEEGPSAAQAQLRSGLAKAQADALSSARGGSGWGDSSSALRAGLREQSRLGSEAVNQAAQLRAQENAQWRERAASNLAAAGGLQAQLGTSQSARGLAATQAGAQLGLAGAQSAGSLESEAAYRAGALGLQGTTAGSQLEANAAKEAEALRLAGQQTSAELDVNAAARAAEIASSGATNAANIRAGLESTGAGIGANTATAGAGITSNAATAGAGIGANLAGQGAQLGVQGTQAGAGFDQAAAIRAAELAQAGQIAGGQFTTGGAQFGTQGMIQAAGLEQNALAAAAGTQQQAYNAQIGGELAGMDVLSQQANLAMGYNEQLQQRYEQQRALELEQERNTQGWVSTIAGGISGGAGALGALFSDVRMKREIAPADEEAMSLARQYYPDPAEQNMSVGPSVGDATEPSSPEELRAAEAYARERWPEAYSEGYSGESFRSPEARAIWEAGPKDVKNIEATPYPELQRARAEGRPVRVSEPGPAEYPPPVNAETGEPVGWAGPMWRSPDEPGKENAAAVNPKTGEWLPYAPMPRGEGEHGVPPITTTVTKYREPEESIQARALRGARQVGSDVASGARELGGNVIRRARDVGRNAVRGARRIDEAVQGIRDDAARGYGRVGEAIERTFGADEQAMNSARGAPPYSWEYRDPSLYGPGRFAGPMAQDLERTPLGRTAVVETPQGKAIDGGRLAALGFAATSAQQREIDRLRQEVELLRRAA